jgi:flagellar basal body-associated protein FliL
MSAETPATAVAAAAAPKSGGGKMGAIIGIVLSAAISGGAAFGGVKLASKASTPPVEVVKATPPGPTVMLDPFIANVADKEGKTHAVKLTIAIELERDAKDEEFKIFIPRARDAVLSYIRTVTYEELGSKEGVDGIRAEILERLHAAGAMPAQRVLVTDLISQ